MKQKSTFFPADVGTEWIFEGDGEIERITIEESTVVARENCLKVEWWLENKELNLKNYNKQTEYWKFAEDGVILLGRRASGFEKVFAKPFYFVKYNKGEKWTGEINLGLRKVQLDYSNEGEELVDTKMGTYKGLRIRLVVDDVIMDRWFSPEIGILKYVSYTKNHKGELIQTSEKVLAAYNKK
jgi:hypothetical protein